MLEGIEPVAVRQAKIEQHHVRLVSAHGIDGCRDGSRYGDAMTGTFEQQPQRVYHQRAVFDQEDVSQCDAELMTVAFQLPLAPASR